MCVCLCVWIYNVSACACLRLTYIPCAYYMHAPANFDHKNSAITTAIVIAETAKSCKILQQTNKHHHAACMQRTRCDSKPSFSPVFRSNFCASLPPQQALVASYPTDQVLRTERWNYLFVQVELLLCCSSMPQVRRCACRALWLGADASIITVAVQSLNR